ncbi:4455_t:CDS:2, partial [Acaulospora morrowiae]
MEEKAYSNTDPTSIPSSIGDQSPEYSDNVYSNLENDCENDVIPKFDPIKCTENSNDHFNELESSNFVEGANDPVDLCNKIPNFYPLLDFCVDTESTEFAVENIIVSQEFLKKLCNDMIPGSYESISKVDYASLNTKSLGFIGIYGRYEVIARYFLQKNVIDEEIDNNTEIIEPHLKPGIYLLIEKEHGFIIHWPEKNCYDNNTSSKAKSNLVTLHRYLTKLTDAVFCLMNTQDLMIFDFDFFDKCKGANDDDSIIDEYEVEEKIQDEKDFIVHTGFKLNIKDGNSKEKLTLDSYPPPVMPIESCYNQSFIICRTVEPIKLTEEYKLIDKSSDQVLNAFKDTNLRVSPSIGLKTLINLARVLSVGSEFIKSYNNEISATRKDREEEKQKNEDILVVDSTLLSSLLRYRIKNMYWYVLNVLMFSITSNQCFYIRLLEKTSEDESNQE